MSDALWTRELVRRPCPLCQGTIHRKIADRMQHGLDLQTVICTQCSFVFTNPLPPRAIYDRFYREAYAQYYGHIALSPREEQIPDFVRQRLGQIEAVRPFSGIRLLEIGPGQGSFLWWAREWGCTIYGVEPSPEFCRALAATGVPHKQGSLDDVTPEIVGRFDILAMFHVLEHFWDPNTALERCAALLKVNGLLVLEVPNILKPFRSLDRYFLRYVHPSTFSPATLRAILGKHGFTVLLLEDQGAGWKEPQNIFVIASQVGHVPLEPVPSADTVVQLLNSYRAHWRLLGAPRWYAHRAYVRIRRPWLRAAMKAKRWLRRRRR